MVVLASAELNRWVGRSGRNYLRTRDYLEGFQSEWGTARSIASMDGADHFRMRKAVRSGNSRSVVEDRMDDLFAIARRAFGDWGIGKVVAGEMACQRLIGEQIAQLSVSIEPSDILDDLLKFEYRALLVHVMRVLPRFTLFTPRMKRYRKRVLDLYAQIHASHTPAQREGKRRDLVDDLMELHQADPQFLPETDLGFSFIAPIIAGHYTGSAMSFTIYELLKNPALLETDRSRGGRAVRQRRPGRGGSQSVRYRCNPPFRHGGAAAASDHTAACAHSAELIRGRGHGSAGAQHGLDRIFCHPLYGRALSGTGQVRYRSLCGTP